VIRKRPTLKSGLGAVNLLLRSKLSAKSVDTVAADRGAGDLKVRVDAAAIDNEPLGRGGIVSIDVDGRYAYALAGSSAVVGVEFIAKLPRGASACETNWYELIRAVNGAYLNCPGYRRGHQGANDRRRVQDTRGDGRQIGAGRQGARGNINLCRHAVAQNSTGGVDQ